MAAPITPASLPDQLFQRLVHDVLDGRYAPGDKLPSQRTLAAEYGVNMASLRAAIDRLAQMRLIEVRQGESMRVADWRKSGGLEVVAHAVTLDPALLASVFEARRLLLRESAQLAAERATEAQRQEISDLAAAYGAATTAAERQAIDFAFMSAVIEAAGNLVFTLILNSMRAGYLAQGEEFQSMLPAGNALAARYTHLARMIAGGHGTKAAKAMTALADAQLKALVGA